MSAIIIDPVEIVRRILSSEPDRYAAAKALQKLAEADLELRESLIAHYRPNLLSEICAEAVREEAAGFRSRGRRAARSEIDGPLQSRIGAIKAALDVWTLPDKSKLQSATREQILAAIDFHRAQLATHRQAVLFYEAITKRLQPGQQVSARWSLEELAVLLESLQV